MPDFTFDDIEKLGDAISKHGPTITKIGDALSQNNQFINNTGNALCERGEFMEEVAERIVEGLLESLQDKFEGILRDMDSKIEQHVRSCIRIVSLEGKVDKEHLKTEAKQTTEGQRLSGLSEKTAEIERAHASWKAEHKKYHWENEASWGIMTLIKRNLNKFVWGVIVVLSFLFVTGVSLRQALLHFTGWDDAVKTLPKDAPKNDK